LHFPFSLSRLLLRYATREICRIDISKHRDDPLFDRNRQLFDRLLVPNRRKDLESRVLARTRKMTGPSKPFIHKGFKEIVASAGRIGTPCA
jgi:hypothetical protein